MSYEITESIDDLRLDPRAGRFWQICSQWVECAEIMILKNEKPVNQYDWPLELAEMWRLWDLYVRIKEYGYHRHLSIMADAETFDPVDGVHRASVLYAMEKKVPAVLIKRPKSRKNRWVFNGMWKPAENEHDT